MRGNAQFGRITVKGLLALLVLAALVFSAFKIVPAYVNNYELQDAIETEARYALPNRKSQDEIQREVYKKAQDIGVPVTEKDILVTMAPDTVVISISYAVPVDLPVYHFALQFHPRADNHSL